MIFQAFLWLDFILLPSFSSSLTHTSTCCAFCSVHVQVTVTVPVTKNLHLMPGSTPWPHWPHENSSDLTKPEIVQCRVRTVISTGRRMHALLQEVTSINSLTVLMKYVLPCVLSHGGLAVDSWACWCDLLLNFTPAMGTFHTSGFHKESTSCLCTTSWLNHPFKRFGPEQENSNRQIVMEFTACYPKGCFPIPVIPTWDQIKIVNKSSSINTCMQVTSLFFFFFTEHEADWFQLREKLKLCLLTP